MKILTLLHCNPQLVEEIEGLLLDDLPVHGGRGLGTVYVESIYSL